MPRRSATSRGFGIIAVVTLVTVVVLLAFASWKVYDMWQGNNTNQVAQLQNQVADPYVGWKEYCHNVQPICFKYPADWVVTENHSAQNDVYFVDLSNPSKSVRGDFTSLDNRDGADAPYYTHDFGNLASNYKFVGGYSPSWAIPVPHYKVVDPDYTKRLVAGETTSMVDTARFSLTDRVDASFELEPTGYDKRDESKAKAWFETEDAKLARLIVKSFYVK